MAVEATAAGLSLTNYFMKRRMLPKIPRQLFPYLSKRMRVTVKKRLITRGLYYIDAKGQEIYTSKSDWATVHNGYELHGRKHIYFTKSFSS